MRLHPVNIRLQIPQVETGRWAHSNLRLVRIWLKFSERAQLLNFQVSLCNVLFRHHLVGLSHTFAAVFVL